MSAKSDRSEVPIDWARALGAVLAILAWGLACGGDGSAVRRHTYPPDFRYIPEAELHASMQELAWQTVEIQQVLAAPHLPEASRRSRVLESLQRMEDATSALGPGGWPSNHPRLSRNLDAFREDIRRARRGVEAEPANYFFARSVSDACQRCHVRDR